MRARLTPLRQVGGHASTEVMKSGWAELSQRDVTEIVDGCGILADALEEYAGNIVGRDGGDVQDHQSSRSNRFFPVEGLVNGHAGDALAARGGGGRNHSAAGSRSGGLAGDSALSRLSGTRAPVVWLSGVGRCSAGRLR